jgi:hypothetical protein
MKYVLLSALMLIVPISGCSQSEDTDSGEGATVNCNLALNGNQTLEGAWKGLRSNLERIKNNDCNVDAIEAACSRAIEALTEIGCVDQGLTICLNCNPYRSECGGQEKACSIDLDAENKQ